ncbi:FG-GAP-like repeat-containing protein [Streptomyces sp. NPDC006307]|uniref:FG-GAP-like repeat-containing protein n=1 Tax=Streptomyces sp. NPDC006307 TaxID=3156748 RepID=UPI0033AEE7DB
MRNLRISLRAAATAALTALGVLATAVPSAHAASGYDRCPQGKFCLFDNVDGTGTMATYSGSTATLGTFDNKASGMRNRTGLYACVYSQPRYEYSDSVRHVALQAGNEDYAYGFEHIKDENSYLDNNVSSFRLARTQHECGTGLEYMPWYSPSESSERGPQEFGDFNADGTTDLLFRSVHGNLWLQRGDSTATRIGTGWQSMTALLRHGDRNGDGAEDIVARDTAGALWMYPGNGTGGLKRRVQIGTGWQSLKHLTAVGDFNGDGSKGDLVSTDSTGALWLHPARAAGTVGPRQKIGSSGWQSMTALVGAGDMNGDRRNDLVARDSSGNLWLYPGRGTGTLGPRKLIGTSWKKFSRVFAVGDANGDGSNDLYALEDPLLYLYANNGTARLRESGVDWDWDRREIAF